MSLITVLLSIVSVADAEFDTTKPFSLFEPKAPLQVCPKDLIKEGQVKLTGLMYVSKNNWAVWINEQLLTPEKENSNFEIQSVSKKHVKFRLKKTGQELTLALNEIYVYPKT